MRKVLIIVLAALLVVGAGAVALASTATSADETTSDATPPTNPPTGRWDAGSEQVGPPMIGMALGLTQDQLDAMDAIRQEQAEPMQDLQAQLRDLQTQYQEALDSNDKDKIAQISDDFATLQQEMTQLRDDTQAKLLDVLTPEQQELYNQYKDQAPSGEWGLFDGFGGFGMPGSPCGHGQFDHPRGDKTPSDGQTR